MWDSGGKVPEITFRDVGDKALAIQINRRYACVSVKHQRPLGSRMPMQLSYAACGQSHIDAGNRLGNCQLPDRDLARPSALLHTLVSKAERILEGLHGASVGGRRKERIRILRIQRGIAGARGTGTSTILGRVRFLILSGGAYRR